MSNLLKAAIAALILTSAQPLYAQSMALPVSVTWTKNQAGKHQWNVPVEFRLYDSRNNQISSATVYSKSGGAIHVFRVPVNVGRGSSVATTVYYVKAFVYGKALTVPPISGQPLQDKWTVVFRINSKGNFQHDSSQSTSHGPAAEISYKENIFRLVRGKDLKK
jgi:hypothetical protein